MTMMTKFLAGAAGIAGIAAFAAPASAQYAKPYGYANPYGYAQSYGYGNQYRHQQQMTHMATQRCAAAVNARLARQTSTGGIVGAILGVPQARGQVVSFTQVTPTRTNVRVRGLATSGRMAGYGPYGVGAYGALGYAYQPDVSFRCDVDYRGRVRNVSLNRRR